MTVFDPVRFIMTVFDRINLVPDPVNIGRSGVDPVRNFRVTGTVNQGVYMAVNSNILVFLAPLPPISRGFFPKHFLSPQGSN